MNQEKLIEIIKNNDIIVPNVLFRNYKSLNITSDELIVLIYLINMDSPISFNVKSMGEYLNINEDMLLKLIYSLKDKSILEIKLVKNNKNISEEYIFIDNLYIKLSLFIIDNSISSETKGTNLYELFENEFGRTLSSMDFEIINTWVKDGFSEEFIKEALKEAKFNNVCSFRYIDTIIYEWKRKGLKTIDDIQKYKKNYKLNKKSTEPKKEIFDYNWLENE